MIAIIDYGMGNTHSVYNAMKYIGVQAVITHEAQAIQKADRIILPGVGAFGAAMDNLHNYRVLEVLNEEVKIKGKPFLGICLGMQLLAEKGTEKGIFNGLGWIKGEVQRLQFQDESLKLPHVGWNDITIMKETPLLKGLKKEKAFYFVHSYALQLVESADLAANSDYGVVFTAAVIKDNIFGTQFHPEKSQKNGLTVLENFVNWRV